VRKECVINNVEFVPCTVVFKRGKRVTTHFQANYSYYKNIVCFIYIFQDAFYKCFLRPHNKPQQQYVLYTKGTKITKGNAKFPDKNVFWTKKENTQKQQSKHNYILMLQICWEI